jgi:cytochrome c553/dsDNA-binding SOS-regulon protein
MRNCRSFFVFLACLPALGAHAAEDRQIDFDRDVRPILARSCWKCHGPDKQQGGVRLDRRDALLAAGDSGQAPVSPGKADASALIRRIEAVDPAERMPAEAGPLSGEQIAILRAWIEQGAVWPESAGTGGSAVRREMAVTQEDRQHWSYLPLSSPNLPADQDAAWCETPIDRFILAALEAKGLHPNPPAERHTLVRRLYFDLLGLPPSPAEVEAFVADNSPRAYEELVDRLLASPHYGERWGRHWLDLARYADSGGLETDADRPNAYHYRDFVIRALNDDLPYETFVRWQLAGDEYEPDNPRAIAATGFWTGAPNEMLTDQHLEEERLRLRYNELDDMAVAMGAAFLGLTLGCARCHDHKFDAIPTRDYYRLQCALSTTSRSDVPLATRVQVTEYRQQEAQWIERLKAAKEKLNTWLSEQKRRLGSELRKGKIDALQIADSDKALLKEQPDSEAAKKLAKQHGKALQLSDEDYRRAFSNEERRQWDDHKKELAGVESSKPAALPTALAIADKQAEPAPTWLLSRGDFFSKQEVLSLGFLTVLTGRRSPDEYLAAARKERLLQNSTYQRRALADWMTDSDSGAGALLARVIVNRAWQHHFGEGLVRTVSDFGVRGERPTHPELLEWLTHEFVAGGWRLKPLHRLILTSAVYRQSAAFDDARSQIDPDNRLLWRRRPQRLEAEILRDAVLSVSGELNLAQFGPAFKPPIPREAMLARNTKDPYPMDARDTPATRRRTVYMFHKRVVQHPLMQAFDGPDAATSCGRRSSTTVAPQALALLNDAFLRDRSADFARRMLSSGAGTPEEWVREGYLLALGRPPRDGEAAACAAFLAEQLSRRAARNNNLSADEVRLRALTDFCQALLGLNEFIYVD